MPKHVVCPNCASGDCEDCTGPGCYCDCQIPSDGPRIDFGDDDGPDTYCCFPGRCCMPGIHLSEECHTAEMMEQMIADDEA